MDVGGRLLVYLLGNDDVQWLRENLAAVVAYGRQERDREGFNRLRVVIAASEPELVAAEAKALFEALQDRDERMHLHVVSKDAAAL